MIIRELKHLHGQMNLNYFIQNWNIFGRYRLTLQTQFSTLNNGLSGYFCTILSMKFVIILQDAVYFFYMNIWFVYNSAPSKHKGSFRIRLASCNQVVPFQHILYHEYQIISHKLSSLLTGVWTSHIKGERAQHRAKESWVLWTTIYFLVAKGTGSLVKPAIVF